MTEKEKENRIHSFALSFLERQQIIPNLYADQIIRGYKEGYHQAEKDLEVKDVNIAEMADEYYDALMKESDWMDVDTMGHCRLAHDEIMQKPAWSEEDERFVHGLIRGLAAKRDIHGHTTFSSDCIDITETIDWLKSLKGRVQQKQEWNEEDKDFMYDTLSNLTELKDRYGEGYGNVGKCIDWIKSLRPQNRWKPNDEQLEALKDSIHIKSFENPSYNPLWGLYEQLKKLKEEKV